MQTTPRSLTGASRSWKKRPVVVLTFDTDNCPEEAIAHVTEKLDNYGLRGTFFCTRRYHCLPLRHETAIHPFISSFSSLSDIIKPVSALIEQIPEAVGNRCHQLTCNGNLYTELIRLGIHYDSSWPFILEPNLTPFLLHTGLVQLPVYWMEGVYFQTGTLPEPLERQPAPGLRVFLFHPVHLWHNSTPDSVSNLLSLPYEKRYRTDLRQHGYGVDVFFDELLVRLSDRDIDCRTGAEVAEEAKARTADGGEVEVFG
jgi:hypothetical protein